MKPPRGFYSLWRLSRFYLLITKISKFNNHSRILYRGRRRRSNIMLIKGCGSGVAILFSLLLLLPGAQAEQPFDFTQCVSSTQAILSVTEELTVRRSDSKGIIVSNLANKAFDNMTTH
jgi:hypothetical protein